MVAAQFARRPRPTVYIVSGEDSADRAYRSLAAYLGLERVVRFPERTDYPWKDDAPDDAVVAARCAALGRVARGEHCVLVASARALLRCVRERVLGIDALRGGRGGAVRRRAAHARGHGIYQFGRRRRPRLVLGARGRRRHLSRSGDGAGAHRVLRRRDRSHSPHGGLYGPDHRRRGRGRDLSVSRAGPDRRGGQAYQCGAVSAGAKRHRARRDARDGPAAHRHPRARPLPAVAVRAHGEPAGPSFRRHAGDLVGAALSVRRLRACVRGPGAPRRRREGGAPRRALRAPPGARLRSPAALELREPDPRRRRGDRRAQARAARARRLGQPFHLAHPGGGEQPLRGAVRHPRPRRARVHGAELHRRVDSLRGIALKRSGERQRVRWRCADG